MEKDKITKQENYLERIPKRMSAIEWSVADDGVVTLQIKNTGIFNRIAQKLLRKPAITYIHLDRIGSYLWPILDGKRNIIELGELVNIEFGEEAHPLYERLAKYFQILDSYHFISWNNSSK